MKLSDLIKRVDELSTQAQVVAKTEHAGHYGTYPDISKWQGFKAAVLSFLLKTFGNEHPYYKAIEKEHGSPTSIKTAIAILASIREEMSGGMVDQRKITGHR